ncbi:hypothetical protein CYMTET_35419, partial [Cymbomonas tetramitiformis]
VLHNPDSIKQLVGDAVPTGTLENNTENEELTTDEQMDKWPPEKTIKESKFKRAIEKIRVYKKLPEAALSATLRKSKSDVTARLGAPVFPPDVHPHFVSGCTMALPDIVRFVAHAFHTPGAMELIQALLTPVQPTDKRPPHPGPLADKNPPHPG